MKEGWAPVPLNLRRHYFRCRISLCGRFQIYTDRQLLPDDADREGKCGICQLRLRQSRARGDAGEEPRAGRLMHELRQAIPGPVLAMATPGCTHCYGLGMVPDGRTRGRRIICACVDRAVFRVCHKRLLDNEISPNLRDREYSADLYLTARRTLKPMDWKVFVLHFLLGGDWRICCGRTGMDRGTFFHAVYRIEETLGQTFRELRPYSLFPIDEYYGWRANGVPAKGANCGYPGISEVQIPPDPDAASRGQPGGRGGSGPGVGESPERPPRSRAGGTGSANGRSRRARRSRSQALAEEAQKGVGEANAHHRP